MDRAAGLKVIIAGGRNYWNFPLLKVKCDKILKSVKVAEIVSGSCSTGLHTHTRGDTTKVYGADGLGERYAGVYKYPVKIFPADWLTFGNSAGPLRNKQMSEYADVAIVFWDGKSKGSKNIIDLMQAAGKPVRIIKYA